MFAKSHSGQADRGMHMVGRAHDHRVEFLVNTIQHLTVVPEALGPGKLFKGPRRALIVHVTQGDDIDLVAGKPTEIVSTTTAATHNGNTQFIVGRTACSSNQRRARHPHTSSGTCCPEERLSSVDSL